MNLGIKNNIKKVQTNRAIDVIDDEIYKGAMADLTSKKNKIEVELEKCNANLSNLAKRVRSVVLTCSKLGDLWQNGTLELCQKIQRLAFPKGIEWDKSIKNYRTIEVNAALDIIHRFSTNYAEKKEDKPPELEICPLGCG